MMQSARPIAHRRVAGARAGGTLVALCLGGCSVSPTHNILGSFFPTWMYCALLGVVVAAVAHKVLARAGVADSLPAPLLVYLAITVAAAFGFWLIWLG